MDGRAARARVRRRDDAKGRITQAKRGPARDQVMETGATAWRLKVSPALSVMLASTVYVPGGTVDGALLGAGPLGGSGWPALSVGCDGAGRGARRREPRP